MTGPDHYREGARYAAMAATHLTEDPRDMRIAEVAAWTAQAYATLALVAATAANHAEIGQMDEDERAAWHRAGAW